MNKSINAAGGTWYKMEKDWADELLKTSGKVENIKIKIWDYDAFGRPGRFEVTCEIGGVAKLYRHTN